MSTYNYFVPYQERVIYFNAISTKIFSLNSEEHQRLQSLMQNLEFFESKYNSVFQYLKKQGFIIDAGLNELDIIRFRNRMSVYANKQYSISINPTLECNFACWYCYEKHPQGYMQSETMEKLKKHLMYMVEKQRITALHLSWFGGEPLLYFNEVVYPISVYAKQLCAQNHIPFYNAMTSNASLFTEDMLPMLNEIELKTYQITIDGDEKRHNKIRNDHGKPSFSTIINNVKMLCDFIPDVRITLRVNFDNVTLERANLSDVFQLFTLEQRQKIKVDFQRVWQTREYEMTENKTVLDLYDQCVQLGFQQIVANENVFLIGRYYKCYVDRFFHTEMNYDGKIYRCTVHGYDDKYVVGELADDGHINWNGKALVQRYGKATFENDMCLKCKYLPLCMGPCSQSVIENEGKRLECMCPLKDCEVTPESAIISYYKSKLTNGNKEMWW